MAGRFVQVAHGMRQQSEQAVGVLEIRLTTMKNPVTEEPEDVQLIKSTGFSSKNSVLGTSTHYRYTGGPLHDHSGKYAESAPFEYAGP